VLVVMDPEGAALRCVLARECESCEFRLVGVLLRGAEILKQRKRADGLVGRANVDDA
jgi:hypothetical protein